jgi:DNA-binding CsgD family transcriptional regulator
LAATALKPFPFEHARTLLLLAERWQVAGAADSARQTFESMAATTWASRAARNQDQRRPDNPAAAALGSLTAAELRVAVAVGSGRSNREAADELFISVKTVDHHLQRIYRKLDIKGRSSLAVLVTKGVAPGEPAATERPAASHGGGRDHRFPWLPPAAPSDADDDPWAGAELPDVALSDEQLDFLSAFAEQPTLPRFRGLGDATASFEAS